jgi:hypothetical protein
VVFGIDPVVVLRVDPTSLPALIRAAAYRVAMADEEARSKASGAGG